MLAVLGLLLAVFFSPLITIATEVNCYAPDGTSADNLSFVACNKLGINEQGVYSSCCRLDGDANLRDLCTSSGLCLSTSDGILRREYCTDKTWKSPACVNVCTDPKTGGSMSGPAEMTACSDGSGTYCCGHNELGCCGTKDAVVIPSQASVVRDISNNQVSVAFKQATIGLAVVVGVVLIAAAIEITWLFRRNKIIKQQLTEKLAEVQASMTLSPQMVPYNPPKDVSLPGSPGAPFEMNMSSTQYQRFSELDARVLSAQSETNSPAPSHQADDGINSSDARL